MCEFYDHGQLMRVDLTEKQNHCLKLIRKGFSNKRIADALTISPRTVESYIDQLKEKFRVSCKSEIAYTLNADY
ncbi:MAG: hypothetical protein CMM87_03045 [Rickettsiales bacterium]|nr:hypothetical protein [Rickettsiales bacterium]